MAVIVYSSEADENEQRLLERICFTDTHICRSIDEFRRRLNAPSDLRRIIILSLKDREEIYRIAMTLELYSDLLLIVVIASDDPETLRAARSLRPRYIAYTDGDFKDVATVLHRIIRHYG